MSTVPPRSRARTCPGRHREPCPGHRQRPGLRAACRREVIGDRNRSLISRRALHASRRLRYADRHLAREGSGGLLNAVRAGPARPRPRAPARYLAAHLRLTLQGDEVRHATLPVAVRLDDGAEVASLDLAAYPVAVAPLGDAERAAAARTLQAAFRRAAPEVLGMALEAIARRARRDLLRMADYYASLDGEMARAVDRARSPEERTRREAKRRLLPQELEARRAQLRDRLAARLGAELVAATVVETEVDACDIPVRRRTRATTLVLRRRAGDGVLEGPACANCARSALPARLRRRAASALRALRPGRTPRCRPLSGLPAARHGRLSRASRRGPDRGATAGALRRRRARPRSTGPHVVDDDPRGRCARERTVGGDECRVTGPRCRDIEGVVGRDVPPERPGILEQLPMRETLDAPAPQIVDRLGGTSLPQPAGEHLTPEHGEHLRIEKLGGGQRRSPEEITHALAERRQQQVFDCGRRVHDEDQPPSSRSRSARISSSERAAGRPRSTG